MTTTIEAGSIPAGTAISLAYGVDAYVNGDDNARAITNPNIDNHNGTSGTYTLTTAQVQSLTTVGGINAAGNGAMMAFYPINRPFDRAYSGYWGPAISHFFLRDNVANSFTYHIHDNGLAVAYSNIPSGTNTTIQTGMGFATTFYGELAWTWNNTAAGTSAKELTVPIGTPVCLRLNCSNFDTNPLTDAAFRVDMPPGLPINGSYTGSGFTSPPTIIAATSGSTFCNVSTATVPASGSGTILLPVSTATYGRWTVGSDMISGLVKIGSVGGVQPAVLTVKSEVNYLSAAATTVGRNGNVTYTVKLPAGVTANAPLTATIGYTGTTASFSALPTSVTIPVGENSKTFTITASATAVHNASVTATITALSGTNSDCVDIGTTKAVTTTIVVPVLTQPANQTVCSGTTTTVTFAGSNVVPANCSWTNSNTAIGLPASGAGNISFTSANATAAPITGSITVTPAGGDPKTFTITVNPLLTPSVAITANPGFQMCEDAASSITFTANPTNGGSAPTYSWKLDGVLVGTGNTYTHTDLRTIRKATITCTMTSNAGCLTTATASDTKSIRVSPCSIPVNKHIRSGIGQ